MMKFTKPHFEALDGLRGIAAIMIVVFHIYEILAPDLTKSPVAHGFLAVDFFFCLSGFVIGYAYDDRVNKEKGIRQFLVNRLIRLQPLVILGTIFGVIAFLLDPFLQLSPITEFGWVKILLATLCSLLLLPSPILGRYENVFPLNAPAWSLSMEYFISLVYAFVFVRLSKKWLTAFLIISAIALAFVAYYRGNILGGWSAETYADGFARVCFSFLAGLFIYRFKLIIKNKIQFIFPALLLIAVFMIPHLDKDWFTEFAIVTLIFPAIVAFSAGIQVGGFTLKLCRFFGSLSYPLYMMHYWMIWILGGYAATNPEQKELYWVSAGIFAGSILLAYFAQKIFDEPVRKWLTMKYGGRKLKQKG